MPLVVDVVLRACRVHGPLLVGEFRSDADDPEVVVGEVHDVVSESDGCGAVVGFATEDDFFEDNIEVCE